MSLFQIIYYGAPGTGKSYEVDKLLETKRVNNKYIFRTTFHPEYSYSDFIGQLLPIVKDDIITYDFQPGVFTQALKKAFQDLTKPVYLIIEEMSRGNVAAIFGDIFQLLDRNDKFNSRYPIRNSLIASQIHQIDDEDDLIYLPSNFNIIGTVNTSDQNVFVMDTAFKRRFDWKYISTLPVTNDDGTIFDGDNIEFSIYQDSIEYKVNWHEFYVKLNGFITNRDRGLGLSEDKQIGQFFIKFSKHMSLNEINDKLKNKLMQYLWEDVESAVYSSTKSLFDERISSFSDLQLAFESNKQIFSNNFFNYFGKDRFGVN